MIDTPGWEFVEEEDEEGSACGCGHEHGEEHDHEHDHAEDDEDEDEDEAMDEDELEGDEDEDDEDEDELDEEEAAKWDMLEAQVAGDLLRRNLGRVDRVKDVFPLGKLLACYRPANNSQLHRYAQFGPGPYAQVQRAVL